MPPFGGLLQLVAFGAQDIYLTGNPVIQMYFQTINGKKIYNGLIEQFSRNPTLKFHEYHYCLQENERNFQVCHLNRKINELKNHQDICIQILNLDWLLCFDVRELICTHLPVPKYEDSDSEESNSEESDSEESNSESNSEESEIEYDSDTESDSESDTDNYSESDSEYRIYPPS